MDTYLFLWNPKRWAWTNLEDNIQEVYRTGKCPEDWNCGNTKSIDVGDRAFVVKVGGEPRGIMASGFVTSKPFMKKHWENENKEVLYVDIIFEALLNPTKEPILTIDILKQGKMASQQWTPQASGISVKQELVDQLEAVWFDFLTTQKIRYNPFILHEDERQKTYTEGIANQVTLTRYERNLFARKLCLQNQGYSCTVCGFNFEQVYGDIGKEFIHVHHLTQIAKIGKEYNVDPMSDLRPVCPNCHAMLHRKKDGVSIEYLKSLMVTDQHSH